MYGFYVYWFDFVDKCWFLVQIWFNQMVEFIKVCYYVVFGFFNGIEIIGCLDNDNCCCCDGNDMIVKLWVWVL